MSFSCEIKGAEGIDLCELYDINTGLLGLACSCGFHCGSSDPYNLSDIRNVVSQCGFGHHFDVAQAVFSTIQQMLQSNLETLQEKHCDTCTCATIKKHCWNVEAVKRFLAIPAINVKSISGGY